MWWHVAIVTGYQTTTSAVTFSPGHRDNGRIVSNDWGFRPGQGDEIRFLRYRDEPAYLLDTMM